MLDKTTEKTIIVLGCARSGTSLVAGLLNIVGVNMSFRMNPSTKNPGGAHDDSEIVSLMYKMGVDRHCGLDLKKKYDKDIKELIKTRRKPHELWGWKSALTHFYIDLFLPYTHNPHLVFIFRNPLNIIKSGLFNEIETYDLTEVVAVKTKGIAEQIGLLGEIIKKHSGLPQIYTTFENIKNDPIKEAKILAQFLDVEFEKNT